MDRLYLAWFTFPPVVWFWNLTHKDLIERWRKIAYKELDKNEGRALKGR